MAISWRAALTSHLRADAGVSALVAARVFSGAMDPEITDKPYIVINQAASRHIRHLSGGAGRVVTRMVVTCVAADEETSCDVADAVRVSLDNFMGNLNGTDNAKVFVDTISGDALAPADGGNPDIFIATLVMNVFAQESVTP